jgi:DDE superfamily endonuclease
MRFGCSCNARGCGSKLFALEQARSDVARRRRRWRSWQASLDPRRLVFIDETWIKTSMAPLRGWGPKGARVRGFAPHGHWRTLTFLGALRCDQLTAPCVFDGPINGECFRAYVKQQLVPVLKQGDIVIMDNLGSHKSAAIRRIIRAAGARLWYLPQFWGGDTQIERCSMRSFEMCLNEIHGTGGSTVCTPNPRFHRTAIAPAERGRSSRRKHSF